MKLKPYQNIPSSGARGVELFEIKGEQYLAIPQLSEDINGDTPNMNGGNSETYVLIYKWQDNKFVEYQKIPSQGNEHTSFYTIADRHFLAVASIRGGANPNFTMDVDSKVYEWIDGAFVYFQAFDTFAAKSCDFFEINSHHYLVYSQGVKEPGVDIEKQCYTQIFRWNDSSFELFQSIPVSWGYETCFFSIEGKFFLALADNLEASKILQWDGTKFELFQEIEAQGGGRDFCHFIHEGSHYLAFANLLHDSSIYKWDNGVFTKVLSLDGVAARSFYAYQDNGNTYLFRTNFISGTRQEPVAKLKSVIYKFNSTCEPVETYDTYGGTDAKVFVRDNKKFAVVSNSLSETIRFDTPTIVYEIL